MALRFAAKVASAVLPWSTGRVRTCLAGAVLALGLTSSQPAAAYCAARSCDPDAENASCRLDARTGCSAEGVELFRPDGCVYFAVQEGVAERTLGLRDDEFEAAIQRAFDAWANVDCAGDGPPAIIAQALGPADVARPFACASSPELNADVWLVRDDLSMFVTTSSGATAGITHTRIMSETGEVFDSDVSLNELWFLVQRESDIEDFLHVVAMHEAGHALGLAHSQDDGALMFRNYRVSRDRELTQDDIDGICALYPPRALQCAERELEESAIDRDACSERQADGDNAMNDSDSGCAIGRQSRDRGGAWAVAALLALYVARSRFRRRTS
jgi:hypothetical protein